MTDFPLSTCLLFVLGLGESQCKTEADAGFSGCQPKEVGRVAPKKTTGLCCLASPCQSHGGQGGQTVTHPEPLRHPLAGRVLCIPSPSSYSFSSDSPKALTVSGSTQEIVLGSRGTIDKGWRGTENMIHTAGFGSMDLNAISPTPTELRGHHGKSVTMAASCMVLFCYEHFLSLQPLLEQALAADGPRMQICVLDVLF